MTDLLARLKSGRAALGDVTVDGVKFGLRILTEQDYLAAQIATAKAMGEEGLELSVATSEAFESEKSSQLLIRALVDLETMKPVTNDAKALRESVRRDQMATMINQYLDHERKFSPSDRTLSDEELSALLVDVKKNAEMTLSSGLSIDTLKRLITALVSQPAT